MSMTALQRMSVGDLVKAFETIALEQDSALLYDGIGKFNRLFDRMEAVKAELRQRDGDQRRALFPLYRHRNAQVRLKAAIVTLALAPERARELLRAIIEQKECPQSVRQRNAERPRRRKSNRRVIS